MAAPRMGSNQSTEAGMGEELVEEEKISMVCQEAGKLFSVDFVNTTDGERSDSNAFPGRNSQHNLMDILFEASSESVHNIISGEDSDSTRDTCDSPDFPKGGRIHTGTSHKQDSQGITSLKSLFPGLLSPPIFKTGLGARNRSSSRSKLKTSRSKERLHSDARGLGCYTNRGNKKNSSTGQHLLPRSQTIPVDCYRRRRNQAQEEEEEEHIKKMMDMKTWQMYLRITEARKRSNFASSPSIAATSIIKHRAGGQGPTFPKLVAATSTYEQQQQQQQQSDYGHFHHHDDASVQSSEHDFIFDLED